MSTANPTCRTQARRKALHTRNAAAGGRDFFGLDSLEIQTDDAGRPAKPATLLVTFVGKAPRRRHHHHHHGHGQGAQDDPGYDLTEDNVLITRGGRAVSGLAVKVTMQPSDGPAEDDRMAVEVTGPFDASTYTLEVVQAGDANKPTGPRRPPPGFDPRFTTLDFRFCPGDQSDLDCKQDASCPPLVRAEPEVNYLAKDYESFRRLIRDRLSLLMPDWKETHAPDIGVALVELLAYVGDSLSYSQDAAATEAYIGTARRRVSVRRHARLVDYVMHEGCNARVWACLSTDRDVSLFGDDLTLLSGAPGGLPPASRLLSERQLSDLPPGSYEPFKPMRLPPAEMRVDFRPDDVLDPHGLGQALAAGAGPLEQQLWRHLAPATQQRIRQPGDAEFLELAQRLADDLTGFVHGQDLLDGEPPPDGEWRPLWAALRDETRRLALARPKGRDRHRLRRWILEEAFPDFLASERKLHLYHAHNGIFLYAWGEDECCLPAGTTSATLVDDMVWQKRHPTQAACRPHGKRLLHLRPGDVLFFEEVRGPRTGDPADADPARRQAVRLTKVTPAFDRLLGDRFLLDVEWCADDALTFPLCLSAVAPEVLAPDGTLLECQLITDVSLARGNVVLADHGRWLTPDQPLPAVPTAPTPVACDGPGRPNRQPAKAGRYRPSLADGPLTWAAPLARGELGGVDPHSQPPPQPASGRLTQDPRRAAPQAWLDLIDGPGPGIWLPRIDLIDSGPDDAHFVVETDNDGTAYFRFGDGQLGRAPEAEVVFLPTYRSGSGRDGNVGADAITRVVLARGVGASLEVRNPLPAVGGTEPESADVVRQLAPFTFRTDPRRAVSADDYARLAEKFPDPTFTQSVPKVRAAAAALRWLGSWYEVLVAVHPQAVPEDVPTLPDEVAAYLEPYRRIGHDLVVRFAEYVPLKVTLTVCVLPEYFRGHVEAALRDVFSNRDLPGGGRGFFHPDNLTFGQGVAFSKIVAAAQAVEGVQSVTARVRRLVAAPGEGPTDDVLPIGPLEVARVDNDPSRPENGSLKLEMGGGR